MDPNELFNTVLEMEKALAFMPHGDNEEERRETAQRKDEALRSILSIGVTLKNGATNSLSEADAKLLGVALLFLRDAQEEEGFVLPPHPNKDLCNLLKQNEDAVLGEYKNKATSLWHDVLDNIFKEDKKKKKSFKQIKFCLERTIKKLQALLSTYQNDLPVRLELARALFLRAKIIRRKGFTVPLKKRDKLQDALEILKAESIKDLSEAKRLTAGIYYELARIADDYDWFEGMTDEGWEALVEAEAANSLKANSEDDVLLLSLAEKYRDNAKYKTYLEEIKTIKEKNNLDAAWAYWLSGYDSKAVEQANQAAQCMDNYDSFSHVAWERFVRLVRQMAKKDCAGWKVATLNAWEACRRLEQKTNHLHLRWYWSRQRELYDLAFNAADNLEKKAEIADSIKSRPALTLSQIEASLNANELKALREQEELGYLDRYIPNLKPTKLPQDQNNNKKTWKEAPSPWIVVHFYLENRKNESEYKPTGHAVIYNAKNNEWRKETFYQTPIWSAFWAWQEAYRLHGDKPDAPTKCGDILEKLCLVIGKEMAFLFDKNIFPEDQPVLFVTHDFLHRLPLHMAMKNDENGDRIVWAETHKATYLPAFWIRQKRRQDESSNTSLLAPSVLINFTDSSEDPARKTLLNQALKDLFAKKLIQLYDPADKNLFLNMKPTSLLAIMSHGQSHPINMFASQLLAHNNTAWVTVQEIMSSKMNLEKTQIILAACEADLVPPITSSVDEHISISTALLHKGAKEVLGTLWRAYSQTTNNLLIEIYKNLPITSLCNILHTWQVSYLKAYTRKLKRNRNGALVDLYHSIPFRIVGLY